MDLDTGTPVVRSPGPNTSCTNPANPSVCVKYWVALLMIGANTLMMIRTYLKNCNYLFGGKTKEKLTTSKNWLTNSIFSLVVSLKYIIEA